MKYLKLIRIKHWIKNILIFLPIICAGMLNSDSIVKTILGFLSFSLISSFIYIINDIKDIEKDKNHPRKKNRPLASGVVKKHTAIAIAVVMLILSLSITIIINKSITDLSLYLLLSYMIINIAYSLGLKNVAIIDVVLLSSGFILRVYYGASLFDIDVSCWLFLTILNASLFLGLGKRRKELMNTKESRIVLKDYNESFLEKFQYLALTLTIVFYSLWTIEQNIKYLYFTIPLLMIIFMKYCLFIEKNDEGDPITVLFEDKILILLCIIYGLSMILFWMVF